MRDMPHIIQATFCFIRCPAVTITLCTPPFTFIRRVFIVFKGNIFEKITSYMKVFCS